MIFYKLSSKGDYQAEFAKGNDWEGIKCPVDEGHQRAGRRITDLKIDLPSAKVPHFMTTILSDWIITEEVAALFEEAGFTGYTLKPVIVDKVKRGNKNDIPLLWEFIVTGRGGDAHPKSGIKLKYECSACGDILYTGFGKGLFVDESQWDGSDFFIIWPLPKFIIVTERVKEFIEKHKLKNCKLIPTTELIGKGEKGGLAPGKRSWL